MEIEVHGYTESGTIDATIDGQRMSVPDVPGNRHRQAIAEWEGEGNTVPAYVPPAVDLTAYAAEVRWQKETGGIVVNGATIPTARSDQAMISGAYSFARDNPAETIDFKASTGWVQLSAAQMIAIGSAVASHVQACFTAERQIAADVDAEIITTTAEIDSDGRWP